MASAGDVSSIFLDEVGRRLGREGGDDEGRAFEGFCYVCGGLQAFGQLDVRQYLGLRLVVLIVRACKPPQT